MIFVDAHVHIYDCFDLEKFFDSAFANFKSEASRLGQEDAFIAILLLTETSKDNWFQRLTSYACSKVGIGNKTISGWKFHPTDENCSLRVLHGGGQSILLIAGRQIVTAEDLEVLALLTDRRFKDGAPLEGLIQAVGNSDGIPVVPWGFGKWTGRRGMILSNLLESSKASELFLGDNGGRAAFLPPPYHFKLAASKGIRVLPGSDPLPFHSESHRAGSFGFSLEGSISPDQPGRDFRQILLDPSTRPRAYGLLEKPYRFLRNQLAIQILKQRRKLQKLKPSKKSCRMG